MLENINIEALQAELEFHRQNQSMVEREIKMLIADNQKLSNQVGILLKEKLINTQKMQNNDYATTQVDELRKQVSVLTKERDSVHVLWQTSQKTIEALETELKTYQGYDGVSLQLNKAHSVDDLQMKLETSLNDYINLEKKYKELSQIKTNLEKEFQTRDKEVFTLKEKCTELENKVFELIKCAEGSKLQWAFEVKNNENLKIQINQFQKDIVNHLKKEVEAKSKVEEALQLFDMVTVQRDEAYKKIAESSDEITKLKDSLATVKYETERKFQREIDEVKDMYNEKVGDMLNHMRNLDNELVEKGLLLTKTMRDNKILRATNEIYLKKQTHLASEVDPRLAVAEQRLEAMYNELVCSERRNIQLTSEKQQLILDLRRQQDSWARDSRRRDWEEKILKNNQDELKRQVENLQKALEDTHAMVEKLQNMLISRTEQNNRMFSSKEEEVLELNKHLQKQMDISKKWKESYVQMTQKLKERLKSLEAENKNLQITSNYEEGVLTDNI